MKNYLRYNFVGTMLIQDANWVGEYMARCGTKKKKTTKKKTTRKKTTKKKKKR
jgi:hypothetical protein